MMPDRRFDDKEVGQILKAAAEMQSSLTKTGSADGITLQELQRLAEEVGLNPDNIEEAARNLQPDVSWKSRGSSNSSLLERTIRGEITEETWEDLVTEVRRITGKPGVTELNGSTREWLGGSETESVMFSATTRGGRTQFKLLGDCSGEVAMTWTIGFVLTFLSSLAPLIVTAKQHLGTAPLLVLALTCFAALLGYYVTLSVVRNSRRRHSSQIEALTARIVELAESRVNSALAPTGFRENLYNASQAPEQALNQPDPAVIVQIEGQSQ